MSLEGEILVRLAWNGRQVERVTIRSTRPHAAARVLVGRSAADAAATVPLLFSVCANAQGAAAAAALQVASDPSRGPDVIAQHEPRVTREIVQEYLRGLLVDWPIAAGHLPHTQPVATARRRIADAARMDDPDAVPGDACEQLADALRALAAEHVFGIGIGAWLAIDDAATLAAWANRRATLPATLLDELLLTAPELGSSDVATMPAATESALMNSVVPAMQASRDFARVPTWNGAPVETGALARTGTRKLVAALKAEHGNTAAVRLVARLSELALLLMPADDAPRASHALPWVQGFAAGPDEAVAAVQTARGLLLHRVRLASGQVADYQIVAPTEWNFHPAGPLARGLAGTDAADEASLLRAAAIAVQALDPCVACRVEVGHA
jgi:hypothetical protein